jgi:hypothetical protein
MSKYSHISFVELKFPDEPLSNAFLAKHEADHMNVAVDLWNEAYIDRHYPVTDADCRKFFANSAYLKLPKIPSTIFYIFGEYNVYTWLVNNSRLNTFKKALTNEYEAFVKVSGPSILRLEIRK